MVQFKVHGPIIGKLASQWGPSLSDCLEIQATFKSGIAVKGTWRTVSNAFFSLKNFYYVFYFLFISHRSVNLYSTQLHIFLWSF